MATESMLHADPAVLHLVEDSSFDGRRSWRRFRKHRAAVLGCVLLGLLLLFIVGGALFVPYDKATVPAIIHKFQPPSSQFVLGTDQLGQDVLARTIYGGQLSLLIGVLSMIVSVAVGTTIGGLAGYLGGFIDSVLMRLTEAVLTIPRLFLLLTLSKFMGGRLPSVNILGRDFSGGAVVVIQVIGFTSWTTLARIIRAEVLSLKQREFVLAAQAIGVTRWRILWRHILPNALTSVIVASTLGVAGAILTEAYISFLGLGIDTTGKTPTWGSMIQVGYNNLERAPWMWIIPGGFIVITVLTINFIGDGLRDALDPL